MNLLSVKSAKAIWLFPTSDLNPRGQALQQEAIDKVCERYSFGSKLTFAAVLEATSKNAPTEFSGGSFSSKSGLSISVNLKMFNDGIVAETNSGTSDADDFLHDFIAWLPMGLGLPPYTGIIRKKIYSSEMYVSCKKSLTLINPKLQTLCASFSAEAALAIRGEKTISYQVGALNFLADPADVQNQNVAAFRFERALNAPFSENRYYAAAPLTTERHLEFLQALEEILNG